MDSASTQPIGPLDDDELLTLVPSVGPYKLLGPCLLFQRVGEGGFGKVYRGRHLTFTYPFDCAVKCLFGERDVERFQQEATLGASLSHENLVRVYDAGSFAHLHYLVMEWVEGETVVDRARRRGGSLPFDEVLEIARQAARGLAHLHGKGLVHRDLKPANVMVGFDGLVKVADLGIAKSAAAGAPGPTLTGQVFGTPRYMPPEQFEDTSRVGPSGDVYSLGATLYRLLMGRDGVEGTSAREIERELERKGHPRLAGGGLDLPPEFVALLDRCTRTKAEDRPRDGAELADALEHLDAPRARLGADEALVTLRAGGPAFGPSKEDLAAARRARPQTTRAAAPPAVAATATAIGGRVADGTVSKGTVSDGTVSARDTAFDPERAAPPMVGPLPGATAGGRGRKLVLVGSGLALVAAAYVFLFERKPGAVAPTSAPAAAAPADSGARTDTESAKGLEPVVQIAPPTETQPTRTSNAPVAAAPTRDESAAIDPKPPDLAPPKLPEGPSIPGFRRELLPEHRAPDPARNLVCYVPEWGPDAPAALLDLRFVLPRADAEFLIQRTELSGAQFAALGLEPNSLPHRVPPVAPELPQGDLSLEVAERIVARLNELRPKEALWRFAVPTVAEWQEAARATSEHENAPHPFAATDPEPRGVFQTTRLKERAAPKDGEAPGPGQVETVDGVLAPVWSHPQGSLALYNLVGNIGELCHNPGGAQEAAVLGGSFQYSLLDSTVQRVRPRERKESFLDQGLRLCVQLAPR